MTLVTNVFGECLKNCVVAIAKESAWSKFKAEISNRGRAESIIYNDMFE